ncbi:MAG TPA: protein kinase [Vicinamibacterales bacterium]|nr:protein kinase [Vicinamibacterales bacterium]
MALSPGTRLGPYEITAKLGEGGMGEVYRATDTKLKRQVAIKVLPESLAADFERLARFQREAEVLASLNHPNIAGIYGLEDSDGVKALVMELVDGPTLADRIAGRSAKAERGGASAEAPGPRLAPESGSPRGLSLDDTLSIARQIAEALEAAHERGIIHRDLKPSNVKVRDDGTVKVLDFGLAKALGPVGAAASGVSASMSPTITTPAMTQMGMILGTAAYMSPEQAKGRAVDRRADVWAFGAVLYEMLTGKRPFAGDDVSDTLAFVLTKDPDWSALPAATPSALRRLLARCLAKDPRQRLHDIGDARLEIDEAAVEPVAVPPDGPRPYRRAHRTMPWLLAACAVVALVAFWTGRWSAPSTGGAAPTRFTIALPAGQAVRSRPAISRDGRTVAFTAGTPSEEPRLYVQHLDEFGSQVVPGSEGALLPFFSPEGRSLAFFARGQLFRWTMGGGAPQPIADAPVPMGGTWGEDDTIVFVPMWNGGLARVKATGGAQETVLRPDGKEAYAFVHPRFVPGASEILYSAWGKSTGVWRLNLDTGNRSFVAAKADTGMATTSGHLLFGEGDAAGLHPGLLAAPASAAGPIAGTSMMVVPGINYNVWQADLWASVSDTGTLVDVPADVTARTLVLVDQAGRVRPFADQRATYNAVAVSRATGRVAVVADYKVWLLAADGSSRERLAPENREFAENMPFWTSDGNAVVYSSNQSGTWDIFRRALGASSSERLVEKELDQMVEAMASNGTVAYSESTPTNGDDVWLLPPEGDPEPWLRSPRNERPLSFSPDGRWLAYVSDESGRNEVWVKPVSGDGGKVKVSTGEAFTAAWSGDGNRLFYQQAGAMMAVDLGRDENPVVGTRQKLFDGGWALSPFARGEHARFEVMPDGEHFLMVRHESEAIPNRINIVVNWYDELKRLVPVK